MAEAIGRHLAGLVPSEEAQIRVFSAGTSAAPGMPATPEAIRAVESLGIKMPSHASTTLSKAMIEGASAVYGMTMGHIHAAQAMCPQATSRIDLLDPDGMEILDPLGYPQAVYDQAAQTILAAVQRRLSQLASGPGP